MAPTSAAAHQCAVASMSQFVCRAPNSCAAALFGGAAVSSCPQRRVVVRIGKGPAAPGICALRSCRAAGQKRRMGSVVRARLAATVMSVASTVSGQQQQQLGSVEVANEKLCAKKTVDVTTLGNLCVDIVLNVPQLPPESDTERFHYMQQLVASPPDESYWEGGGNANVLIAGARLGLDCVSLAHIGNEKFGQFLHCVLDKEGVKSVAIQDDVVFPLGDKEYDGSTLLCWVLVDPQHEHAFCSRYDFNENPSLSQIRELSVSAKACIERSKALFVNGYVFDELAPSVVLAAMRCAQETGGAVFCDPGPRVYTFFRKSAEHWHILEQLLHGSDVILLTSDEAEAMTGDPDPRTSAKTLLERGRNTKWVVIKMGANGCLIATAKGFHHAPALNVEVVDTVGCGDSFAAAIMLGFIKRRSVPITTTLALANAVGAATAMGQGAGRNVASAAKVLDLLAASQQHCTHLSYEEHSQVLSVDETLSVASPSRTPMKEAACEALNLLNCVLDKSHNNEMLVRQ